MIAFTLQILKQEYKENPATLKQVPILHPSLALGVHEYHIKIIIDSYCCFLQLEFIDLVSLKHEIGDMANSY